MFYRRAGQAREKSDAPPALQHVLELRQKTGGPAKNRGRIEICSVGRQHPPHKARAAPVRARRTERA
ncbi:hypothetical protein EMIT0111MI5_10146 [Burkholderia sp. IT-111MI5]